MNALPAVSPLVVGSLLLAMPLALSASTAASAIVQPPPKWPQWQAYKKRFIQKDGRVIEHSQQGRSTSEGQAYALFHALVANDRERFDRILDWTQHNLTENGFEHGLPAWLWGRRKDGRWGIIDRNAASDADMWLAYTLLEAGDHWRSDRYRRLGLALLRQIEQRETVRLPGLGWMLLPGPNGFRLEGDKGWRLNLSYLPLQLMRRFARSGDRERWQEIIGNSVTLIERSAIGGVVPDWIVYRPDGEIEPATDTTTTKRIGFDAIRVYLWAGMLPPGDPLRSRLLRALKAGCAIALDPTAQEAPGLRIALAPLAKANGQHHCLAGLIGAVDRAWQKNLLGDPPRYYDQNLSMFALAWLEKRFAFKADGGLRMGDHETR